MCDSIELDDYEAVNLLAALRASGIQDHYPNAVKMSEPNPLSVLNSGDWTGQIVSKLEERLEVKPGSSEFHSKRYGLMFPNKTPQEYVDSALRQVQLDVIEQERLEGIERMTRHAHP